MRRIAASPRLTMAIRRSPDHQNQVLHHGATSPASSAPARATASGTCSSSQPARCSTSRRTSPRHAAPSVRIGSVSSADSVVVVHVAPAGEASRAKRPPASPSGSSTSTTTRPDARVRARRQQARDVERPQPQHVEAARLLGVAAVDEQPRQHVVERPVGRLDRPDEVERQQVGPEPGLGGGCRRGQLGDLERAPRPHVGPVVLDRVAGVALHRPGVVDAQDPEAVPWLALGVAADVRAHVPVEQVAVDHARPRAPHPVEHRRRLLAERRRIDDADRARAAVRGRGELGLDLAGRAAGRRAVPEAAVDRVLGGDQHVGDLAPVAAADQVALHDPGEDPLAAMGRPARDLGDRAGRHGGAAGQRQLGRERAERGDELGAVDGDVVAVERLAHVARELLVVDRVGVVEPVADGPPEGEGVLGGDGPDLDAHRIDRRAGPVPTSTDMYPGTYATTKADQPCFIMATSGEVVTYGEFESRTNRLAHLLRDQGLPRLDHYSIFMENNPRYLEMCGAGERVGPLLHGDQLPPHAPTSWRTSSTTASRGCSSRRARSSTSPARSCAMCPAVERWLVVDGPDDEAPFEDYLTAVSGYPDTPIADERQGAAMLYSSGTTGRPKGITRQLADVSPSEALALMQFLIVQWRYREGQIYLSPAPLYHSAPQGAVGLTIRSGGTAIIMERFDPEQYLQLVEQLPRHPQPARADDVQPDAQAARGRQVALRPVVAGDRRPRRRPVPDPGQGGDDRVVGPEDRRVLRGHRGHRLHDVRLRTSGWPTRAPSGSASSACCTSSTTSSTRSPTARRARSGSSRRPASTTGRTRRRRRRRRRRTGR